MNRVMRSYPAILAAILAFGTPVLCVLFALLFGEICWPQRIGAVYVGIAVFMQGFFGSDPERFSHALSEGNTLGNHLNQSSYTVAVFGTLFAAFGDLLPASFYYGVAMCTA